MTPPTFYIGLDLSLQGTGLVVLSDDSVALRVVRRVKVTARNMATTRLVQLRDAVTQALDGIIGSRRSCYAAIEDYAMHGSGRMTALAEWGGVAKVVLWSAQVPMLVVGNSTLKSFCGAPIKGDASKRGVRSAVRAAFNHHAITDDFGEDFDLWDAAALALLLRSRVRVGDACAKALKDKTAGRELTHPKTETQKRLARVSTPQWDTCEGLRPVRGFRSRK